MSDPGRRKPITRLAAMPRRGPICLLACVFALAFASCGSSNDGTIPPDEADTLLSLVAAVQNDAANGECDRAKAHAQELVSEVDQLPNEVDPDVANELAKAATNLEGLSETDCTDTGASGETGVATTSTTSSTTTEVTTAPTTTEETSTTTSTTTDQQPTEQPNQTPPTGQPDQGGGQTGPGGTGGPASGGVTGGGNAG